MKIRDYCILILLVGMSFIFSSCEKVTPPVDHFPDWGEVSVLKNGQPFGYRIWGNTSEVNGNRLVHIFLNSRLDFTYKNEEFLELSVNKPLSRIGDTLCIGYSNIFYPEPVRCPVGTFYSSLKWGDVLGDRYTPIPSEANYMVLTGWNPDELTISGEFQINYHFIGTSHVHEWMADTIRFTEGEFTTYIQDPKKMVK